jgi:hypothetical protein
MARVHPRRNFATFRSFFAREEQDLEIQFIIKVHVLNFEKYVCIFLIFISIQKTRLIKN